MKDRYLVLRGREAFPKRWIPSYSPKPPRQFYLPSLALTIICGETLTLPQGLSDFNLAPMSSSPSSSLHSETETRDFRNEVVQKCFGFNEQAASPTLKALGSVSLRAGGARRGCRSAHSRREQHFQDPKRRTTLQKSSASFSSSWPRPMFARGGKGVSNGGRDTPAHCKIPCEEARDWSEH